jgi:cytoplasmic iron level regulating protein YaaA (DUF328/UPF0246 family)
MDTFGSSLGGARAQVLKTVSETLRAQVDSSTANLLKIRGPLLARARESFDALVQSRALYMPAWQRYSGVVWRHLGASTLSVQQRESIVVPSGLYGVTTAQDDVADYRLKMNSTIAQLGTLSSYWRPLLSPEISSHVGGGTVLDLLPKEHAAAINYEMLEDLCEVVHARFLDASGERAVGHDAKALKGMIARVVLSDGLSAVSSLRWRGWKVFRKKDALEAVAPRRV